MEEEAVEKQGTSFWTLFKAVCKRWLLIGFCAVLGALIGCVYAFTSMSVTKEVWQRSFYLYRTDVVTGDNMISITQSNESNVASLREYFQSQEFKSNVYGEIKDLIFTDIADAAQKEAKFKASVKVSAKQGVQIYAIDQTEAAARVILDKFIEQAEAYVGSTIFATVKIVGEDPFPVPSIVVMPSTAAAIKVDAKDVGAVSGTVTQKDRLMKVVLGAVAGAVAGAALALCLYYFNNRVNSSNMLAVMGIDAVYAGEKRKGGRNESAALAENALRYNFVIEKQGCKVVSFVSPEKTGETRKAIEAQAEVLRGKGYRTLLIAQDKQKADEWKKLIDGAAAQNDFIFIDAAAGTGFDCAAASAAADGVTVIIDQKHTKLKDMKHTKEILDTAKLPVLSAVVVNAKDDFVV